MLTINTTTPQAGGRTSRRRFLEAGALGTLGLSLPTMLRAAAGRVSPTTSGRPHEDVSSFGRAKKCILIFLNGGPSQLDTWDMKPHAPAEVRGELKPIATSVPGIHACELLPLTAQHVDKFKIVRSVTHGDTEHTTSMCTMLTGTYHPRPKVAQTEASPNDHPHLGAIYARSHLSGERVPPFVTLPTLFKPPGNGIWPGQDGGFLGQRYDPFVVHGDKKTAVFRSPSLDLPADIDTRRLENRKMLLGRLNQTFSTIEQSGLLSDFDDFYQKAFSLIRSKRLRSAVDLGNEPRTVQDRYGRHLFGQGLLLARRMMEADIPVVTVYWNDPEPPGPGGGEYDSHGRIYHHMRNRLVPPTDRAMSALFGDLSERGLLDETLVVVMAEFGRTPRINAQAGRDHWPQVQSVLLAGAGISGGTVFGSSDRHAAFPTSHPITPPDLAQSILHLLGVPANMELHDPQGRPVPACRGSLVPELIG